ncbi:MAG: hypothetical protein IT480_17570 [Gammaproteobacteria bacterium]|nr:hypothetical protein [Gammaproteobacteria bacterium]
MLRPSLAMAGMLLLAGCSVLGGGRGDTAHQVQPPPDRDTTVAVLLASTIQTLQRLAQGTPAEQAEILASARAGYERAPLSGAQLRYALVLATPGHAARDAERARTLLRELAAQPEALQPVERALTLVELSQLERELGLQAESERLKAELQRSERERGTLTARRLQAELDENARLRRQLEEAQAKLDAIANIERNISERRNTEVRKP